MAAPYPSVPYQLETALLIQLRDSLHWESSVAPLNASGTYSGTLTAPDADYFSATDYQSRDRELAWMDTRNAAAVVEVSLDVANVWNASVLRPTMVSPQIGHIALSAQDVSSCGLMSRVVHVKNASIPVDALQTDRDLAGRDVLIYETLVEAVNQVFVTPTITSSGAAVSKVTAWSYAEGTAAQQDINAALPLNRDLFKVPDMNLADRDNQMAGYVSQLCQVLKNPFAYADRLYVAVYGVDSREVETYTLISPVFEAGVTYLEGDEVVYEGVVYRVAPGVGTTSDVPWLSPWAWEIVTSPRKRVWTCEPALPGRNRFVYDTINETIQWFRDSANLQHIPQLVAMSVPGIFSGQSLQTVAAVPERKDGQFWRNKAAHVVPEGSSLTDIYSLPTVATSVQKGFQVQPEAASLTIPGNSSVWFPNPLTMAYPQTLPAGTYRVAALVKPDSTVTLAGGENIQGQTGLDGGSDFPDFGQISFSLGLPPTEWAVEFDYTNLSGSASGFRLIATYGPTIVFDDTAPFYFNDSSGNPLPNGTIVTSGVFPVLPTGGSQSFTLAWTGGTGQLHIRAIRFTSTAFPTGHYRMSATMAGQTAVADVIGQDKVPGVMSWEFALGSTLPDDVAINYITDAQLPIKFLRMDLAEETTNLATPNSQGFENYRQDCLLRATRSAQQAFKDAYYSGTAAGTFLSPQDPTTAFYAGTTGIALSYGTWDSDATERWMASIEAAEPRLREIDSVPSDSIVPGRQYYVLAGTLVYEGVTYSPGQYFYGDVATSYTWSVAGQLNQVGAWQQPKATHNGRPCLAPRGVYFDYGYGTMSSAYTPDQTTPELVTAQPWMLAAGFYVAQPEFWLPQNL